MPTEEKIRSNVIELSTKTARKYFEELKYSSDEVDKIVGQPFPLSLRTLLLTIEEMLIHMPAGSDLIYWMLHCIQDTSAPSMPNGPAAVVPLLTDQGQLPLMPQDQQQHTHNNNVLVHHQEQNHSFKDLHTHHKQR